ncbi:transcription initiation factor TFIID subunit 7 [Bacillus rossius redtenbacheri]|uniref:transcription initiation factor TFIID subunit 7 n=1 Tax=Bacillus rossius redtenbacheri TaxID=93214 RepID=UPI002FDD2339
MNRHPEVKRDQDAPAELECQVILRLPSEPAKALREALRGGMHLKDRLTIKLENDMRYGEVRFDHWLMHAKVVDLPTVVESLKTIDNKSFYKTADVCQLLICKEEDDQTTDEESPAKAKKKDPNKVDKKFLWPHGIAPPLKNVRRRRFRKTLKKKYIEAPEIEKEVKRLLRVDNDAVSVKWEVISEDDDKVKLEVKEEGGVSRAPFEVGNQHSADVAEHDIFGEAVSDSEEETNINIMELEDETSRPSGEDSRLSDSASLQGSMDRRQPLVTQFSQEMFAPRGAPKLVHIKQEQPDFPIKSELGEMTFNFEMVKTEMPSAEAEEQYSMDNQLSRAHVQARLADLEQQLAELRVRRQQQELEIAGMENYALRQRFQDILDSLLSEQLEKEQEYQELTSLMQMQ